MPYFLLAFLALVVLAILRVLLRNKQAIVVWVDRAIPFPISYMAAQLCTKGFNFTTYAGSIRHYFPSLGRQSGTVLAHITGVSPLRGSLRAAPIA